MQKHESCLGLSSCSENCQVKGSNQAFYSLSHKNSYFTVAIQFINKPFFFTKEFQIINAEAMTTLAKSQIFKVSDLMWLGNNHQQILKSLG